MAKKDNEKTAAIDANIKGGEIISESIMRIPVKSKIIDEDISNSDKFEVIFRENRPFEIVIRGNLFRWEPNEKKIMSIDDINTDEFKLQKDNFVVIRR